MNDMITVRGFIATKPSLRQTTNNTDVTDFRLASTARRYDADKGEWVDAGGPNWYTVNCYRFLAQNVTDSVSVGDAVLVHGRLKIREWSNHAGAKRHSVEIEASSVGPDLALGTATYTKTAGRVSHPMHEPQNTKTGGVGPSSGDVVDLDAESRVEFRLLRGHEPAPVAEAATS
ncbi:MAG: single-stranded DNA-binding protein [Kocuria sp.]|nr:single-stranded DNA-binding protein [Kocuria sp.]